MRIKKQLFIAVMAYFLIFQTILAPISTTAFAVGKDNEDEQIENVEELASKEENELENIIKEVTYSDKEGNQVDENEHEGDILTHVNWTVENKENAKGYTETFELPEQIELSESSADLKTDDTKVGTYKTKDNHEVEIELNEDFEALEVQEGNFELEGTIEVEEEEEVSEEKKEASKESEQKAQEENDEQSKETANNEEETEEKKLKKSQQTNIQKKTN